MAAPFGFVAFLQHQIRFAREAALRRPVCPKRQHMAPLSACRFKLSKL